MKQTLPSAAIAILVTATSAQADTLSGVATRIHDGDTLTLKTPDGATHKIRLLGLDAPERDQPGGSASRDALANLVAEATLTVEWQKRDRYGRVLGVVLVERTACQAWCVPIDANLAQLAAGQAWWYQAYARDVPEDLREPYATAEADARAAQAGLWRVPNPEPPWSYRRR